MWTEVDPISSVTKGEVYAEDVLELPRLTLAGLSNMDGPVDLVHKLFPCCSNHRMPLRIDDHPHQTLHEHWRPSSSAHTFLAFDYNTNVNRDIRIYTHIYSYNGYYTYIYAYICIYIHIYVYTHHIRILKYIYTHIHIISSNDLTSVSFNKVG